MVFLLASLIVGLVIGRLTGGRISAISRLRFTHTALAWAAVVVALAAVLGTNALPRALHDALLGVVAGLMLAWLAINIVRSRGLLRAGLVLAIVGCVLNGSVIAANGGRMPTPARLFAHSAGEPPQHLFDHVALTGSTPLRPLADVFSYRIPGLVRGALSPGDIFLFFGATFVLMAGMRLPPRTRQNLPQPARSSGVSG